LLQNAELKRRPGNRQKVTVLTKHLAARPATGPSCPYRLVKEKISHPVGLEASRKWRRTRLKEIRPDLRLGMGMGGDTVRTGGAFSEVEVRAPGFKERVL